MNFPALVLAMVALLSPPLPQSSDVVELSAQEWPLKPGPRTIKAYVTYPGPSRTVTDINRKTGIMLSLHNWGGTGFTGTADPAFLADHYNVVVVGVDYLQSGPWPEQAPYPYDFGWFQALDALRALHFVYSGLTNEKICFAKDRIFITGGSGGGNVTLMANKLAPNTFAVVVDLCGMKKLSDDIAYGLPGESSLNARYSRENNSPFFLTPDAQRFRFIGAPDQLKQWQKQGGKAKIFTIHGVADDVCPYADALEYSENSRDAGVDLTFVPVTDEMVDGKTFVSTGHNLGVHALIVDRFAGDYLSSGGAKALRLSGPNDFERASIIRYQTEGAQWIIDFSNGAPEGRCETVKEIGRFE